MTHREGKRETSLSSFVVQIRINCLSLKSARCSFVLLFQLLNALTWSRTQKLAATNICLLVGLQIKVGRVYHETGNKSGRPQLTLRRGFLGNKRANPTTSSGLAPAQQRTRHKPMKIQYCVGHDNRKRGVVRSSAVGAARLLLE